jgi:hypothetical protein
MFSRCSGGVCGGVSGVNDGVGSKRDEVVEIGELIVVERSC